MKLYHGSSAVIEHPCLDKGKPYNDYGRGFYCTENIEMASEWAAKGKEPPAFANCYELNLKGLNILDLSKSPYNVLNWIAVLLKNRQFELDLEVAKVVRQYLFDNFMPPIGEADVVIGYRADDSYFNYANAFVNNGLSVAKLNEALSLGKLGLQVALISERAFDNLRFIGANEVLWDEYHAAYTKRDRTARREWTELKGVAKVSKDDLFAMDIVRMELKHGDARLRSILPR